MNRVTPLFLSLIMAFIGVPILAQCAALCGGIIVFIIGFLADALGIDGPLKDHLSTLFLILTCVMMFACGRLWNKENQSETRVEWRHCLLILPAILALICWVFSLQQAGLDFMQVKPNWLSNALIAPWFAMSIVLVLNQWYWGILLLPVCSQVSFALGYGGKQWLSLRVKLRCICLAILTLCAAAAAYQAWLHAQKFPQTLYEDLSRRDFDPSKWGNKLTPIQGAPTLQLTQNWPRMDGATAALPLYASAFYGLSERPKHFPVDRYLDNSGTPQAYTNIIENKADIIFVAQPSQAQKQFAEVYGAHLVYTPIAREAFVFVVNKNNPVQTLSDTQIRAIYSGVVTQWREVGGDNNPIQAWQRPKDSGSQTAMLAKVMKETRMSSAPQARIATMMGDVIDVVAEYQNTQGAIGYTFRYYATQMKASNDIKLLAINGISPTVDNIRNGTYPYTVDVYMVTHEHPTAETQKLMDWFLSSQGQKLVEDVGYVPLHPTDHSMEKGKGKMKNKRIFAVVLCCFIAAPTLADTVRNAQGNSVGSVREDSSGNKTYRDRNGNQQGSSSVSSSGETTYKDKHGNTRGRANTSTSGETTYRDNNGNVSGTAKTDSSGVTTYRDNHGNIAGTSRTDSSGNKTFKDKNGNQVASLSQ